jgi:hypothetical protein
MEFNYENGDLHQNFEYIEYTCTNSDESIVLEDIQYNDTVIFESEELECAINLRAFSKFYCWYCEY